MGYHLWNGTMESVRRYYDYGEYDSDQIDMFNDTVYDVAMPISINGISSFSLEEIDALTTRFKSEEDFRNWLNKTKCLSLTEKLGHIMITHKYKGLKEDAVVYNSPLLARCAEEVKSKKNNGYKENDIWLSRSDELLKLAKRIAKYLENEDIRGGILQLEFIPALKEGLIGYARSCELGTQKNDSENFEAIYMGCLRYSSLRKFVVWEKQYLLDKKLAKEKERENQRENEKEETRLQEMRERPFKSSVVQAIDEMRTPTGEIDMDRVWSVMDVDDVYSSDIDDLNYVGLKTYDKKTTTDNKTGKK